MLQFNKRKQFYHAYRVIELLSFAFSEQHYKMLFAVCICTCEENEGFQREYLFDAGFPIGARASLLAHDFP